MGDQSLAVSIVIRKAVVTLIINSGSTAIPRGMKTTVSSKTAWLDTKKIERR